MHRNYGLCQINLFEVAMPRLEIVAPFLHTGYFNILHRSDTEDKEKTSENQ